MRSFSRLMKKEMECTTAGHNDLGILAKNDYLKYSMVPGAGPHRG